MSASPDHAAIVIGAAGGMGGAIARVFAEEGRPLILCDLNAERLEGHGVRDDRRGRRFRSGLSGADHSGVG